MIKSKPCKLCFSTYHTAAFCPIKPRTPIKRTAIKVKQNAKGLTSKTAKVSKKKAPTRSQLVKKLDKVFSEYIRMSKSVNGMAECVTCGTIKPWREMQNGHFFTRGRQATRWDIDNCNIQDAACNVFLKGNYINYTRYMIDKHGREFVDELEFRSLNGDKISTPELKELIEFYSGQVKQLL